MGVKGALPRISGHATSARPAGRQLGWVAAKRPRWLLRGNFVRALDPCVLSQPPNLRPGERDIDAGNATAAAHQLDNSRAVDDELAAGCMVVAVLVIPPPPWLLPQTREIIQSSYISYRPTNFSLSLSLCHCEFSLR